MAECVVLLPSEGSSIRITNPNGSAPLSFVIPSEAEGSAVRPGWLPKASGSHTRSLALVAGASNSPSSTGESRSPVGPGFSPDTDQLIFLAFRP
jgi:hypothetical protein